MNLLLLVRGYPAYSNAIGRWPDLAGVLSQIKVASESVGTSDAKTDALAKIKVLRAILAALDALPNIVVESSGTDKAPSFFSAETNWNALAKDVLNLLYGTPIILGQTSFVIVQRRTQDLTLEDDAILRNNGRKY